MSEWPKPGENFGIEGFLSEGATIYYSHDFRSRSLGRVSDLLSRVPEGRDLHPLQLRSVLLYGLFAAYAAQGELSDEISDVPPVSVEVGFDDDFTFLSIRFFAGETVEIDFASLTSAVSVPVPTAFGEIIAELRKFAPALYVRHAEKKDAIELLVGFRREAAEPESVFEVISVPEKRIPAIDGKYIELGDADFLKQLTQYVAKTKDEENVVQRISQTDVDEEEASEYLKGNTPTYDTEQQTLKASAREPEAVTVIKAEAAAAANAAMAELQAMEDRMRAMSESLSAKEKEIDELKLALSVKRFEADKKISDSNDPRKTAAAPEEESFGTRLLKGIWPFKKDEASEIPAKREEPVVSTVHETHEPTANVEAMVVKGVVSGDLDDEVLKIAGPASLQEIETEVAKRLGQSNLLNHDSTFNQVISEMEREAKDEKSKQWSNTLKSELIAERSKLADLQREISRQLKAKENEYRNREQGLATELKKREDLLRQKDLMLQQKTIQLANANQSIEKNKVVATGGSGDEQGLKLKLGTTQKLAQMKEEENKLLMQRLKDMENKLMVAQSKSSKGVDPQMMGRLQSAEKRVEEFKRMNQRLTESLQKAQEKRGEQEQLETRRKVENIERQWNDARKNLEKSEKKLKEVIESEGKLKVELGKAQEENRKMKQTLARQQTEGGSDSGSNSGSNNAA